MGFGCFLNESSLERSSRAALDAQDIKSGAGQYFSLQ